MGAVGNEVELASPLSWSLHRHKADSRHRPEETILYRIIQQNLETFLSLVHEECGRSLPDFVEKEFREYLKTTPKLKIPNSHIQKTTPSDLNSDYGNQKKRGIVCPIPWEISEKVSELIRRERAQVEGVIGNLKSKKYGFNKPNVKS